MQAEIRHTEIPILTKRLITIMYILGIQDIQLEKNLLIYKTKFIILNKIGKKTWQLKLKKEIS